MNRHHGLNVDDAIIYRVDNQRYVITELNPHDNNDCFGLDRNGRLHRLECGRCAVVETNIFVYGTLMSGFHNNQRLQYSDLIGEARAIDDNLAMRCNGHYPYVRRVMPGEYRCNIVGELWRVDADTLKDLDRLEGVPHHYQRRRIGVSIDDTKIYHAWIYINNDGQGDEVRSGDWRSWQKEKESMRSS